MDNDSDKQADKLSKRTPMPTEIKVVQETPSHSRRSMTMSKTDSDDIGSIYTLKEELSAYISKGGSEDYHAIYPGTEPSDYNYATERLNPLSTNLVESTSHLVKGCLGAGLLTMHVGYMHGGLWASLGVTIFIGTIVPYNMYMLVYSAQKMYVRLRVSKLTYPDLAEASAATGPFTCFRKYSKVFRYTVDTCLFLELCGTCCIYEILIASTLKPVLEAISTQAAERNYSLRVYLVMIMLPLFLLCMIRNLKLLAPFSMLADLFLATCVLTAIYYSLSETGKLSDRHAARGFQGLIKFCGILIYSIDGIAVALPIENNMRQPQYFNTVLQIGMSIVMVTVTAIGFFGYLGWGENCKSPFILHLPISTVSSALQFLIAITLTVSFAVNFWVPFRIIWHYIGKRYKDYRAFWERFFRALHFLLITLFSIAYPNLIRLMTVLGNFFLVFTTLIFPPLIESMVFWREHKKGEVRWRLVKNVGIVVIGSFISIGSIYLE